MSATPVSIARPLVEVEDLRVRFGPYGPPVVEGMSFSLGRGECLAFVGESGSGKSVTSRALVGLAGYRSRVEARRLDFDGQDLRGFKEGDWRRIRGARIGFVMQDALGSFDPLRRIGSEIAESLRPNETLGRAARAAHAVELLKSVGVPEPELRALQYPGQLSGGLRQRALIASAIACRPELLIADEPTSSLDAPVQAQILALLESLQNENTGMLVISHDLAVVSRLADRIAVVWQGRIVEQGPTEAILQDPHHPYTKSLVFAAAKVHSRRCDFPQAARSPGTGGGTGIDVIRAVGLTKSYFGPDARRRAAVSSVSFALGAGETVGIVGESGSGKTTLARMLLGLEKPDDGVVELGGRAWQRAGAREQREARRAIQIVFQDPLGSFDPRFTVERVLGEALGISGSPRGPERRKRAVELLELVRLDEDTLGRRPIELSGGQRQRVAIARALAPQPKVLICDEPVSALDVSVQAQILELLAGLKARFGLACLFISHDLGIIRGISDRILVMKDGLIVESGNADDVFERPQHPYTRLLLGAIPKLELERTVLSA
jgi:peptide/nickel transport system ATP-binding protein